MTTRQHVNDPARDTRERVRELKALGLSVPAIAAQLRISRQRVYQHLKAIQEEER